MGKNLKKKFPVGSVHSARVLGLDWSGGVAVCSLQKTLLAGVLRLEELAIGQRLTTTVKQFVKHGLLVDVGTHLTGLVPWMFLTDVPLKHPQRKFVPGDKLQCRVLRPEGQCGEKNSFISLPNLSFSMKSSIWSPVLRWN